MVLGGVCGAEVLRRVEDAEAVYIILRADLYERLTDDDLWTESIITNLQNQNKSYSKGFSLSHFAYLDILRSYAGANYF